MSAMRLTTAMPQADELEAFVAHVARLAEAARANGLTVVAPA